MKRGCSSPTAYPTVERFPAVSYTGQVQVLLISTYDLGRQPFGLASPSAWLRRAGFEVTCVDISRAPLHDADIASAALAAVYLPMHTATRLAAPVFDRIRRVNPSAHLCCYGLYARLNEGWLKERGVLSVLGGEFEEALVSVARAVAAKANNPDDPHERHDIPRLRFVQPDRSDLPPLHRYASLQMPDGSHRVAGATEASRGCKHLCRHCPIVPVYAGQFRVVPIDVVLDDVKSQVANGAEHISFGDPDFFNGPTHAMGLVERFAAECPRVSYDVTIKIEHLLQHADLLPRLRDSGCLFVTSAVESVDDDVLSKLAKGHTRADFVRAVQLCRDVGLTLSPTFVPFTPWTTAEGYLDLLDTIEALDLVDHVAPIQLAIRLLVTSGSELLQLPEIRAQVAPFDPASLTWPWTHDDPRIDALQREVITIVGARSHTSRPTVFDAIAAAARETAGRPARTPIPSRPHVAAPVPVLSEAWYCCAEPDAEMGI